MDSASIRAAIVEVGRRLYARGLISATEGNISVRDGDRLFVTPSGECKGFLTPEEVLTTDLAGHQQDGPGRVSTETRMHTAVYRERPDVGAVVHAHPPTATGFAVAGVPLERPVIAEAVVVLGPVALIPYGTPSSEDLAEHVARGVRGADALLLANHGALTLGTTVFQAWERMETLEQLARVTLVARLLGKENELPQEEVARLLALRRR